MPRLIANAWYHLRIIFREIAIAFATFGGNNPIILVEGIVNNHFDVLVIRPN